MDGRMDGYVDAEKHGKRSRTRETEGEREGTDRFRTERTDYSGDIPGCFSCLILAFSLPAGALGSHARRGSCRLGAPGLSRMCQQCVGKDGGKRAQSGDTGVRRGRGGGPRRLGLGFTDWHSMNHCRICSFIFSFRSGPSVSLRVSWVFTTASWYSSSFSTWRSLLTLSPRLATALTPEGAPWVDEGSWGSGKGAEGLRGESEEDPAPDTCPLLVPETGRTRGLAYTPARNNGHACIRRNCVRSRNSPV